MIKRNTKSVFQPSSLVLRKINNCQLSIVNYLFILLLFLFLPLSSSFAGHFSGKASIPVVEKSGYYHLLLAPDVLAVSQTSLSDIRIEGDSSGQEIPYILSAENPKTPTTSFQYFKITENEFNTKDSITRVVIDNEKKETINQFCIIIQNAEISKHIALKGSDDGKTWYVVKQKTPASMGIKNDTGSEILITDIPSGNYRFYEIQISNPQKDPIKVLKVGKYLFGEIQGKYSEVSLGNFIKKDSADKKTYISFPNIKRNYLINRLRFDIDTKLPYLRGCQIVRPEYRKDKSIYWIVQLSFNISSKGENIIETPLFHLTPGSMIIIDNKDNVPLNINQVTAFQLNRYLTAFLEEGEHYTLYCGDKELTAPQYDLAYFEKNIPQDLPVLKVNTLEDISKEDIPEVTKEINFWETQTFLWLVIAGVGLFLLWVCYAMVKEMKKRK